MADCSKDSGIDATYGNVPADLVSRALWAEFRQLCELLRVRPVHVTLEERELELISSTVVAA